jgi:hypothetical protein
MKTVSYLALVTAICVVIFWVFMALRPANAQQGYRPLSNMGRFHGYVTWPLYCGIAKCNDTRAAAMASENNQTNSRAKRVR